MDKVFDLFKVITHADGGDKYSTNATKYPSNEDCVGLRGYGVDADDPATAKMQFDSLAKYHGNEGRNEFIQFMISPLKETAPDAETAMAITDQVLDPLKDEYLILTGVHKKEHQKSGVHIHSYVGTTNLENGKMLHPTNKLNYKMAQRMADIIQKPVKLVIEKKNKKKGTETNDTPTEEYTSTVQENTTQAIEGSSQDSNNKKKNENDDFNKIFYPRQNTKD